MQCTTTRNQVISDPFLHPHILDSRQSLRVTGGETHETKNEADFNTPTDLKICSDAEEFCASTKGVGRNTIGGATYSVDVDTSNLLESTTLQPHFSHTTQHFFG